MKYLSNIPKNVFLSLNTPILPLYAYTYNIYYFIDWTYYNFAASKPKL